MTALRAWSHDLWLGARLAVSGRDGLARLALIAVGVGMGVAVLLLAASLVTADGARKARENARIMQTDQFGEYDGRAVPLLAAPASTEFRDDHIPGVLFDPLVASPPAPPGLDRIPAHGEVYLSPALADLLASPAGELLRPRIPWRVAGTIGNDGLVDPAELRLYAGADLSPGGSAGSETFYCYGFGAGPQPSGAAPGTVLMALSSGMLLLLPVFILVGAATRIAAGARERRLAALRLVGADANQTSRIATGEALVGSIGGLVAGSVMFLAVTPLAELVTLFGYGAFRADLRPPVLGVVLIALLVPTLAVAAGLVALRHAVAEPLGATRRARPPQRKLWWRLAPLLVGTALLAPLAGAGAGRPSLPVQLALVSGLLLIGVSVPLLLPWLLQRAVGPLAGGPPSWQLAVRRIQLDSGTPARAAAGIAALLTVAVAILTLLAATLPELGNDQAPGGDRLVEVYAGETSPGDPHLVGLAGVAGVRQAHPYQFAYADAGDDPMPVEVLVGNCPVLATFAHLDTCADGDVFVSAGTGPARGQELTFSRWDPGADQPIEVGRWEVPADARPAPARAGGTPAGLPDRQLVLATTAAADIVPAELIQTGVRVLVDPADRDAIERIRNALVPAGPTVAAFYQSPSIEDDPDSGLRNALLAGSLIVLVLAAASMLIVSIEQVRERSQQLAALAAAGVPNRTLGASVLWQALVPFALAATAAIGVGIGLASLFLRAFDTPVAIDWAGVLSLTGACAVAVVAVTVLTLPSLRAATRPESLRAE